MASKFDIAQYLVNIHTLLTAQESTGGLLKSTSLVDEYNRNWDLLKTEIEKETNDETRSSDSGRDSGYETGTDSARDQRGRRL